MNRIKELAEQMRQLQATKDVAKAALTDINKDLDKIRLDLLPIEMENEGIDRVTIEGIGTVSLRTDVRASIRASARPYAWEWLQDNNFEALITHTVNASTLKAWAKEQLESGNNPPDDLFTITPYTYAVITKN